ncbi:UDP-N-acetylglucosamine 1-carboxyvinyltransferase [Thermicanus aegyptius]|uniref:UDP-N-acetylglucosamine 1-carboxyvinyltransferase n=1 Tax=Thermicanus aegyptius TaxID=94009 RepID=UPI000412BA02|nr:UDP-N-acetylglucosamine 1-carboxyvinyltransferase [Thermicanus aegyptius]
MERLIIHGGKPLYGTIRVHGAKNAVLPIMAASLLAEEGVSMLDEVPYLQDVKTMKEVLLSLGVKIEEGDRWVLDSRELTSVEAPYELIGQMRASFLVMGPLLARMGKVKLSFPGGCAIGNRPIDQHLKGFEALGAKIRYEQGYIEAECPKLIGTSIYLDIPSVGATENIMMAACLARGETVIENAAEEPEITDLANFLNGMGAKIRGAGTDTIRIEGVSHLHGTVHTVIPDRIEAGTYMVAFAITEGEGFIEGVIAAHLTPVIAKLREMGVYVSEEERGIHVVGTQKLKPVDIKTLPYPGFPTDMQAQFMALLTKAAGTSVLTETIFENRFMHVPELVRMGAKIRTDGRTAIVEKSELVGAMVQATDLRAGAALILAGLAATGTTEIGQLHHIDRGYVSIESTLKSLGAEIERKSWSEPEGDGSPQRGHHLFIPAPSIARATLK